MDDPLLANLRHILECYSRGYTTLAHYAWDISRSVGLGPDLQLISWGDGTKVPTKGINLVIVGADDNSRLHIRIFDTSGERKTDADEEQLSSPPRAGGSARRGDLETDTDETRQPSTQAKAKAIAALKQELPELLTLGVLPDDKKAHVIIELTSILGSKPSLGWVITPSRLKLLLGKRYRKRIDLSPPEIRALHAFLLNKKRGGFNALLGGSTLLESIAARGKVVFILPSKRIYHDTTGVVLADFRAVTELIDALRVVNPTIQVKIEVQPLCEAGEEENSGDWSKFFEKQSWHKYLDLPGDEAPSVISIGSPRANHASEVLLARIYGCKPFLKAGTPEILPFSFYWRPASNLPSSFVMQEDYLEGNVADWTNYKNKETVSALLAHVKPNDTSDPRPDCPFVAYETDRTSWNTFGIVAASRRREGGQVWVVAAGLEAPASLGAAREIQSLAPLPLNDPDPKSGHVTQQYRLLFQVERVKHNTTTYREVKKLVGKPDILMPSARHFS